MATIFDKLKFNNLDIGNVQSVDEMTVVPILGETKAVVAEPSALKFYGTTDYGTMIFTNESNPSKPAIVPANFMARGPGAQDHAMASGGIVLKGRASFKNACCVEESQGGYLHGAEEMDVLPVDLRKALMFNKIRSTQSYSKLWGSIKMWLEGVPTSSGRHDAHLRYFYDTPDIKASLENFAAEFEPVNDQIGAIIMFSGVPVGIEIMPTDRHWLAYWKLLIRGCYGAELLRRKFIGKVKPNSIVLPDLPEDASPSDVRSILQSYSENLRQDVIPLISGIDITSKKIINNNQMIPLSFIRTSSGGGDMIEQGGHPIYLSLIL